MDIRDGQSAARLDRWMGVVHPFDQLVGQVEDGWLAPARIGQFPVLVRFGVDEFDQVLGGSGCKGLEDGLVRVTNAHPVALRPGQQAQDLFL